MRWSPAMTQRPRDRFPSGNMLDLPDPRRPDGAKPPTNFWWFFFWQHWHDLHALGSHWRDSQQRILCWDFKGVLEEILSEEANTLQIGSVAFPPGQCKCPQLHHCHRLFDQDGHQDSSSHSLLSRLCSLWLLVIPWVHRMSLWDNWEDERGCDKDHWHADTRGLPWGLPEDVGTVQQVHCSRSRLLQRGLEFHVCTINKGAHTKKVWKLI